MAKTELQQALDTIKKYCEQPKVKSFHERMDNASLKQRIEMLKTEFLHYVDHQTIHYMYTQIKKKNPDWDGDYNVVELSKKQVEDCLQTLHWFEQDIKACISHLKK
jgi:flagellar basal body rod protein FlgB